MSKEDSRINISEETYRRCLKAMNEHLRTNASIRNRDIRSLTDIGYDQGITFFNRVLAEKKVERIGAAGSTRYILPQKKAKG